MTNNSDQDLQQVIASLLSQGKAAAEDNKIDDAKAVLEAEVERLRGKLELHEFYSATIFLILLDAAIFPHIGWIGILVIGFLELILLYVFSKYCNVAGLHDCLHTCGEFFIRIASSCKRKED